jgi:hypothetical protein
MMAFEVSAAESAAARTMAAELLIEPITVNRRAADWLAQASGHR